MTDHITTKNITADDVAARGIHNAPQEIVNGEWIEKTEMAGQEHSLIGGNLFAALRQFVKQHRLGRGYGDNLNYVLEGTPGKIITQRIPDVSFVAVDRASERGEKGFYYLAPDLAVEIVSPSETKKDTVEKIADYLRFGTQQVWVIDPDTKQITVYFPNGSTQVYHDTLLGGDVLPGFEVSIASLFEE